METYIVGGYVRDTLLGLHPKDRDWVVVGSSVEEMLEQGYQKIGKEFPVFLHPRTAEVYALARTERKGVTQETDAYASPDVTLEEDLERRDLTINAMAMLPDGQLIDPFGGEDDLQKRQLRHVAATFSEDPVRVLRTARFAARYGFSIAPDTLSFIHQMVADDSLDVLAAERVWAELAKALSESHPDRFIHSLREMNALERVFPEIDRLFGVPQPEAHHPEIDTGTHILLALKIAAQLTEDPLVRFGVLVHDLGKGITKKSLLPRHIGHEGAGVKLVDALCERYRIPRRYQQFGRICSKYHLHTHRAYELKPGTVINMFESIGAFKQPDNLNRFLLVCQADAQGRTGLESKPYPQADYLKQIFEAAAKVSTEPINKAGLVGKAFGDKLHSLRISAARQMIQQLRESF